MASVHGTTAADETNAVKFVLVGGYLWRIGDGSRTWCAIEPGHTQHDACKYAWGDSQIEAILAYIDKFGPPWEKAEDGV